MLNNFFFLCLFFGVFGQDTTTSNDDGFTYPCDSLEDLDCIGNYFANFGQCTKVSHNDGEVINQDKNVAYMPLINATLYSSPVGCIFYGSSVKSLYIDNKSKNLVFSINFEGLNIFSPKGNLKINQRGQVPKWVQDEVNATYSAELTAVIPSAGRNGIEGTSVSAFTTNAYPPIIVGPKISQSSDPVVSTTFNALLADIPTIVQELMLSKAPYFFYVYLQNYFCDYGYEFTGEIIP